MSLSGINMSGEIINKFETDRMSDDGARLVLMLEDGEMKIEHDGLELEDAVPKLPEAEPRYVIYDIKMKNRANIEDFRTVFIVWMPMTSPVRMRMLYSSTKQQITNNIRGIAATIQAEEHDELEMDRIIDKVNKQQGINNTY